MVLLEDRVDAGAGVDGGAVLAADAQRQEHVAVGRGGVGIERAEREQATAWRERRVELPDRRVDVARCRGRRGPAGAVLACLPQVPRAFAALAIAVPPQRAVGGDRREELVGVGVDAGAEVLGRAPPGGGAAHTPQIAVGALLGAGERTERGVVDRAAVERDERIELEVVAGERRLDRRGPRAADEAALGELQTARPLAVPHRGAAVGGEHQAAFVAGGVEGGHRRGLARRMAQLVDGGDQLGRRGLGAGDGQGKEQQQGLRHGSTVPTTRRARAVGGTDRLAAGTSRVDSGSSRP